MSFFDVYENKVLNFFLHGWGFTIDNWGIGLSHGIAEEDTDFSVDEVTGFGYSRINRDSVQWTVSTSGSITNLSTIQWQTVFEVWGVITHFIFFDTMQIGTGDPVFYGQLDNPWNVVLGSEPKFDPGDMVITLD